MSPRLHYFSSVSTDSLNRLFGIDSHVGAASRKVFGTARALMTADVRPVVVSGLIPFPGGKLCSAVRTGSVPYVRLFSLGNGALRRVTAAFSFLWYTAFTVETEDAVLLYNAFPEYILAAAYLCLVRRRAFLDVEDAPRADEAGLRGAMNRFSFRWLKTFCDHRIITVSEQLANNAGFSEHHTNYGTFDEMPRSNEPNQRFKKGVALNFLYGGAIVRETGLDLFCDTVRLLHSRMPELQVNFHVTGLFDFARLESLRLEVEQHSSLRVVIHGDLSSHEYRDLLSSMDVGLCLKLPSHSMGQTTFPSKVIEICSAGLLLCTTDVSDIPSLFSDDLAVVLRTEDSDELAQKIAFISERREEMKLRALRAHEMVAERFSSLRVGTDLRNFIFKNSNELVVKRGDSEHSASEAIVFVWDNFGPPHIDRCEAAARYLQGRFRIIGIELFSRSDTYSWAASSGHIFAKRTLFSSSAISSARIFVSLLKTIAGTGSRHVFLCHYQEWYIFAVALLLRSRGIRVYFMGDSKFDDYSRRVGREWLKSFYLKPYVGALTASVRSKQYLEFLGHDKKPIRLGYDTISVDRIRKLANSPPAPSGYPHNERHFTIVARHVPKKNIALALDAFAQLVAKYKIERRLVLCGSGPLEEELKAQARYLAIDHLVDFRGFVQTDDVCKALSRTLCLILPSIEEQFGQVIPEALAMGIPVALSTNCGARDELVRSGVNGFVFESDNSSGLREFLHSISCDEKLWTEMSKNSELFVRMGDVERFAYSVEQLVRSSPS